MKTDPAQHERDLQRALALVRFARDPALPGMGLMAVVALVGFGTLWFAWRAVARTIFVPLQIPAFVSGGLAAVVLVGLGLALLDLQVGRSFAARERDQLDDLLGEVAQLAAHTDDLKGKARR